MVLENRVSCQKLNEMRKNDSFETKKEALNRVAAIGVKRRRHEVQKENL